VQKLQHLGPEIFLDLNFTIFQHGNGSRYCAVRLPGVRLLDVTRSEG